MGLHGAQRVVHLDVVTVISAWLQLQGLEGETDAGAGICPQCPVAEGIVGVWAVGEARRGEAGDFPFLGVKGENAAVCPESREQLTRQTSLALPFPRMQKIIPAGYHRADGSSWITARPVPQSVQPQTSSKEHTGICLACRAPLSRPFPILQEKHHPKETTEMEEEMYLLSRAE